MREGYGSLAVRSFGIRQLQNPHITPVDRGFECYRQTLPPSSPYILLKRRVLGNSSVTASE